LSALHASVSLSFLLPSLVISEKQAETKSRRYSTPHHGGPIYTVARERQDGCGSWHGRRAPKRKEERWRAETWRTYADDPKRQTKRMDSAGEDERKGQGTPLFGRQSSLASRASPPAGRPVLPVCRRVCLPVGPPLTLR
jgi:hypothetical protein